MTNFVKLALAEEQYSDDSVDSVELEELKSRNNELEERLELGRPTNNINKL